MAKQSAGILVYRKNGEYEVLLAHPGGPFWAKKDDCSWSMPKGEFTDESPLNAAKREFNEESGIKPPDGEYIELGFAKQSSKTIYAFAIEGDVNLELFKSNTFEMEWPPRSGKKQHFPEVDKLEWFTFEVAKNKLVKGQVQLLEALASKLGLVIKEVDSVNNNGQQTSLF
jgi:predicted NUDIX family NTP pyrophosphohydrolase